MQIDNVIKIYELIIENNNLLRSQNLSSLWELKSSLKIKNTWMNLDAIFIMNNVSDMLIHPF